MTEETARRIARATESLYWVGVGLVLSLFGINLELYGRLGSLIAAIHGIH